MAQPPVELHIVSDSTGETAARLVLALEAQFPEQEFEEVRHTRAETVHDLEVAVASARGHAAVVIYTLVDPELRDAMRRLCRRARVHYCDLLGHPIDAVARVSGQAARMTPGSRAPLNPAYFKRIEAIEFAVKYDDGVGRGLDEADIVLVGVSRTSKTPLSIYLGYLGYKAANTPVVRGIELPPELFEIDRTKIVGLTIEADRRAWRAAIARPVAPSARRRPRSACEGLGTAPAARRVVGAADHERPRLLRPPDAAVAWTSGSGLGRGTALARAETARLERGEEA